MTKMLTAGRTWLAAIGLFAGWLSSAGDAAAAERVPPPVTVVFGGDVMLDRGPGHAIAHGQDPFEEFGDFLRDADITVCNLECVVAEGGEPDFDNKVFTFLAPRSVRRC